MGRNYIILIIVAVALAIGILFMDKTGKSAEVDTTSTEASITDSLIDPSRFITVDEVTKRIIQNDPGIMLIDLRPEDQYKSFSLPGAINMPIDSLLTNSSQQLLDIPGMDKVLFSDSNTAPYKALQFCEKQQFKSVFILEGGINEWRSQIVDLKEPSPSAPQEEIDNYSMQLGANQYFYGKKDEASTGKKDLKLNRPMPVIRTKTKAKAGGGC